MSSTTSITDGLKADKKAERTRLKTEWKNYAKPTEALSLITLRLGKYFSATATAYSAVETQYTMGTLLLGAMFVGSSVSRAVQRSEIQNRMRAMSEHGIESMKDERMAFLRPIALVNPIPNLIAEFNPAPTVRAIGLGAYNLVPSREGLKTKTAATLRSLM